MNSQNIEVSSDTMQIVDGKRNHSVIEISNGQCSVGTLKISMSKEHRLKMLMDILTVGFIPSVVVYCITEFTSLIAIVVSVLFGTIAVLLAVLTTICDFNNWLYTINHMQNQMGQWYIEDFANICRSFISAGCKVAAEEKAKAENKNVGAEEKKAE